MSNEVEQIVQQTEALLRLRNEETLQETTPQRLHECLGEVVMSLRSARQIAEERHLDLVECLTQHTAASGDVNSFFTHIITAYNYQ